MTNASGTNNKKKIVVLFGGQSSEHEISRISAEFIIENIDKEKYDIVMTGITKEGKWLKYDGPVGLISSGEWERLAMSDRALLPEMFHTRITCSNNAAASQDSLSSGIVSSFTDVPLTFEASPAFVVSPVDVVFPIIHGTNGEDGTIQGMLELAGIPYVGAGVLGSAIGMDKAYAKIIFEKAGIPQGKFLQIFRKNIENEALLVKVILDIESTLTYPCFIKPSNSGSSVGVSKAHDQEELVKALRFAARYDRKVLAEEYIDGRELECAVLGNDTPEASIIGEVVPCNEFYDYNAKYIDNGSLTIIPADVPEAVSTEVGRLAVKAFTALDCAGMARVDFFLQNSTGKVYINEINTIPGFTGISMYPKLWEASGVSSAQLVDRLISLALERYEDNHRDIE
ncbi:MAG: D-alanine--D-alanine ligase family protein [Clostridiales bacterium]|nr:D-alanine--D-alanine ligase family protein [Clostridiales bacterium]